MHHHAAAPDEIGISNFLLRLALAGMRLDCYTEELSSLDDLLERPEPQHDEIVAWILSHITK